MKSSIPSRLATMPTVCSVTGVFTNRSPSSELGGQYWLTSPELPEANQEEVLAISGGWKTL